MHRNHLLSRTTMFLTMGVTTIACLFSCSDEKDAIKSSEKQITKFTINSVDGAIDQTAKAITLSLPLFCRICNLAVLNISIFNAKKVLILKL